MLFNLFCGGVVLTFCFFDSSLSCVFCIFYFLARICGGVLLAFNCFGPSCTPLLCRVASDEDILLGHTFTMGPHVAKVHNKVNLPL